MAVLCPRSTPGGHPERSACPEYALSFAKGLSKERRSSLRRSVIEGEILHFVQNDKSAVLLTIFMPNRARVANQSPP